MSIAAVILAAGAGRRFGMPKAAVRIGARSLVEIVTDTAVAAGLEPVIVVVPPSVGAPSAAVAVTNDAPGAGVSRSLRLGIEALPRDVQATAILLVDQPTLDVAHLHALDSRRGSTPVVATRTDGVIGPPAILEREGFVLVEALGGDAGLGPLLRADPSLVTPVDHAGIPDVDTPDDLARITEPCPGCGARYLPYHLDEAHPYIGASPACWATFGEVSAREFGDLRYGAVHRHTVDVYAVQHPGTDDRRQRQSVALHLVGICHWLEHDLGVDRLNAITRRLASEDRPWPWLDPPSTYPMTVVDLVPARDSDEHVRLVRQWAESVWEAWRDHHETIRRWAAEVLER